MSTPVSPLLKWSYSGITNWSSGAADAFRLNPKNVQQHAEAFFLSPTPELVILLTCTQLSTRFHACLVPEERKDDNAFCRQP